MKKIDLERKLTQFGWKLSNHGGKHDRWTNGKEYETLPRHRDIDEYLAKKIMKKAKSNPPLKEK
jgi:mRNA interferase HicA